MIVSLTPLEAHASSSEAKTGRCAGMEHIFGPRLRPIEVARAPDRGLFTSRSRMRVDPVEVGNEACAAGLPNAPWRDRRAVSARLFPAGIVRRHQVEQRDRAHDPASETAGFDAP